MTKVYVGRRSKNGTCSVRIVEHGDSRALKLRLDLANRSPTGFEWGYGGSGPAQLALALLADTIGNDDVALRLHQKFKWHVITKLPRDKPWRLSRREVLELAMQCVEEPMK